MYIVNVILIESDCHMKTITVIGLDSEDASAKAEDEALKLAKEKGIDILDKDIEEYLVSGNYDRYGIQIVITHPDIVETEDYRRTKVHET